VLQPGLYSGVRMVGNESELSNGKAISNVKVVIQTDASKKG